ncbi:hypothetical protein [Nocardia sp. NPDC051570]|uniref:hypothetical protein n=1 Tax=Nocardia sp. NPDC051570 TaxID=3364324 RepID=UPI0037A12D16
MSNVIFDIASSLYSASTFSSDEPRTASLSLPVNTRRGVTVRKEPGERGLGALEVRPDTQEGFVDRVDHRLETSVWNSGGCGSFYLSGTGRNIAWWPWFAWQFKRETRRVDLSDLHTEPRVARGPALSAQ